MIGVLVSGSGTNLQALIDDGLPISGVASNNDGVRALERAEAAGIPWRVFALESFADRDERDAAMADWLAEKGAQVVVCAGYMHLLRPCFLERFPSRVVNVHPALLPAFPGARPIEDQLAARVRESGATVHVVDEGIDTGPILLQERVTVTEDDTADTLRARIHEVEHRLLPKAVRELCGL